VIVMGWHPKILLRKNPLNLKSKEEIEQVVQWELNKYWEESVKFFHWEDLSEEKKQKRKVGFIKALEHGVRMKATAFSDATSLKEYFDHQWEGNKRTVLQKWKQLELQNKNKGFEMTPK